MSIEEVLLASGLRPIRVKNVYLFGSRVYGNATLSSDWDVLIIANSPYTEREI